MGQPVLRLQRCREMPRREPPNRRVQPTPLRGPKIVAILKAVFIRRLSRSIWAARLTRNPLGGPFDALDQ